MIGIGVKLDTTIHGDYKIVEYSGRQQRYSVTHGRYVCYFSDFLNDCIAWIKNQPSRRGPA
jgi:hypothetical protein